MLQFAMHSVPAVIHKIVSLFYLKQNCAALTSVTNFKLFVSLDTESTCMHKHQQGQGGRAVG
jgi:hypothetical protein